MKQWRALPLLSALMLVALFTQGVSGWSNGGYSDDPAHPDYGTHDWIAQHALDWLPPEEKQYILDNLATYLYGTELPDNNRAIDGIGDTSKHHIYYTSGEVLIDDSAAVRASSEYERALELLKTGDLAGAAKEAGVVSHYIADMAVFGHVMGATTDWGEEQHHSDYESYVNQRTLSYTSEFNTYLTFDGNLDTVSAYNVTTLLAYDTTLDSDGDLTAIWMDEHYDWSDPVFRQRVGESLNLAVNYVTDVLHTLYTEASATTDLVTLPAEVSETKTKDSTGVVKTGFTAGETVLPSATVKNKATTSKAYLIAIQIGAPDDTVYPTNYIQTTLTAGQMFTFSPSFILPVNATLGAWSFEVNIFDTFPAQAGTTQADPVTQTFTVN